MHAVGWCCHGPRPCRLRLRPNHQSDVGACGLDLTPDHPGFAQGAQRAAEVKQNGFLRACKANLERYSVTFFPLVLVRAGLAYYELWLEANAARDPLRRQSLALAASLPPSVPGCPREIPPQRMSVGAGGFPDIPAPLVISDGPEPPRPCK